MNFRLSSLQQTLIVPPSSRLMSFLPLGRLLFTSCSSGWRPASLPAVGRLCSPPGCCTLLAVPPEEKVLVFPPTDSALCVQPNNVWEDSFILCRKSAT